MNQPIDHARPCNKQALTSTRFAYAFYIELIQCLRQVTTSGILLLSIVVSTAHLNAVDTLPLYNTKPGQNTINTSFDQPSVYCARPPKSSIKGGNLKVKKQHSLSPAVLELLQNFERALQADRVEEARTIYAQLTAHTQVIPNDTFLLATLHLSRLELLKGSHAQALTILDAARKPKNDDLKLPYHLLKARLYIKNSPKHALQHYQSALKVSPADKWEQEDQTIYCRFLTQLERKWARRLERTQRFIAAHLHDEALFELSAQINDLEDQLHPKALKGTDLYKKLHWQWTATSVRLLLDLERFDTAQKLLETEDANDLSEKQKVHRRYLLALTYALNGRSVLAEQALGSEEDPLYLKESLRLIKGRIYLLIDQNVQAKALLKPITTSANIKHSIQATLYYAQLQLNQEKYKDGIALLEKLQIPDEEKFSLLSIEHAYLLAQLYQKTFLQDQATSVQDQKQQQSIRTYEKKLIPALRKILASRRTSHQSFMPAFRLLLQTTQNMETTNEASAFEFSRSLAEKKESLSLLLDSAEYLINQKQCECIDCDMALNLVMTALAHPQLKQALLKQSISFLQSHPLWRCNCEKAHSLPQFHNEIASLYLTHLSVPDKPESSSSQENSNTVLTSATFSHPATLLRSTLLMLEKNRELAPLHSSGSSEEAFQSTRTCFEKAIRESQELINQLNLASTSQLTTRDHPHIVFSIETLFDFTTVCLISLGQTNDTSLHALIYYHVQQLHSLLTSLDIPDHSQLTAKKSCVNALYYYLCGADHQYNLWQEECASLIKNPTSSDQLYQIMIIAAPPSPWESAAHETPFTSHKNPFYSTVLTMAETYLVRSQSLFMHESDLSLNDNEHIMLIQSRLMHLLERSDQAKKTILQLLETASESSSNASLIAGYTRAELALEAFTPGQYISGDPETLRHLHDQVLTQSPAQKAHLMALYYTLLAQQSQKRGVSEQEQTLSAVETIIEELGKSPILDLRQDVQVWWLMHFFELEKAKIQIAQDLEEQALNTLTDCENSLMLEVEKATNKTQENAVTGNDPHNSSPTNFLTLKIEYFSELLNECRYMKAQLLARRTASLAQARREYEKILGENAVLKLQEEHPSTWQILASLESISILINLQHPLKALERLNNLAYEPNTDAHAYTELLKVQCFLALKQHAKAQKNLQAIARSKIYSYPVETLFLRLCEDVQRSIDPINTESI